MHAADDDGLLSFPRNHLTQAHCLHSAVVVRSPQSPSLQAQSRPLTQLQGLRPSVRSGAQRQ